MKIYYSGSLGSSRKLHLYLEKKIGILASYYEFKKKDLEIPEHTNAIFLDSGAFTAFKKGIEIDIKAYIKFVKKFKKKIEVYANLDVIGEAEATLKNQRRMEHNGLWPLPCYHYGEPIDFLRRYLDEKDYVAFGGAVPVAKDRNRLDKWIGECWNEVAKRNKDCKIHMFGVTGIDLIRRYPWTSVDSTSCHIIARYGGIYTPWGSYKINPKVNAGERSWMFKTPVALKNVKKFYKGLTDGRYNFKQAQQNDVEGFLIRLACNILYFESVVDDINENKPTIKETPTGFGM